MAGIFQSVIGNYVTDLAKKLGVGGGMLLVVAIALGVMFLVWKWFHPNPSGSVAQTMTGSGVQVGGDVHGDVNLHAAPKSIRLKYSDRQSIRWNENKRSLNLDNIATLVMIHPQFGNIITLAKQVGPSTHIDKAGPETVLQIAGSAAQITFPGGATGVVGFGMSDMFDFDISVANNIKRVVIGERTFCLRLESIREHAPRDIEYAFAISED